MDFDYCGMVAHQVVLPHQSSRDPSSILSSGSLSIHMGLLKVLRVTSSSQNHVSRLCFSQFCVGVHAWCPVID